MGPVGVIIGSGQCMVDLLDELYTYLVMNYPTSLVFTLLSSIILLSI